MTPAQLETSLANLKLERDAIELYDSLATVEKDARRAAAFRRIAENERRHAEVWARRLREAGVDVPEPDNPRLRVRLIIRAARLFGTRAVSDMVKALEGEEEDSYTAQSDPAVAADVAAIAEDEREHARIWQRLDAEAGKSADGNGHMTRSGSAAAGTETESPPGDVAGLAPVGAQEGSV